MSLIFVFLKNYFLLKLVVQNFKIFSTNGFFFSELSWRLLRQWTFLAVTTSVNFLGGYYVYLWSVNRGSSLFYCCLQYRCTLLDLQYNNKHNVQHWAAVWAQRCDFLQNFLQEKKYLIYHCTMKSKNVLAL